MNILERQERYSITESDKNVSDYLKFAPSEIYSSVQNADVVIMPSHGTEDLFFAGTIDTYDFLRENNLEVEIFATDDEYKELNLHGADIWLGSFIVTNIILPTFCSILGAFVYEKLKAKKDDHISVKIMLEDKDGKTKAVSYDGNADKFKSVLKDIKKFSNEK